MNTKWYQLNTNAMNYSEYDVTMNAFDDSKNINNKNINNNNINI